MLEYHFADIQESDSERQAVFDDVVNKGTLEGSDLRAFITEIEKLIASRPTAPRLSSAKREIERELERFLDTLPRNTFDDIKRELAHEKLVDTIIDEFNELMR